MPCSNTIVFRDRIPENANFCNIVTELGTTSSFIRVSKNVSHPISIIE